MLAVVPPLLRLIVANVDPCSSAMKATCPLLFTLGKVTESKEPALVPLRAIVMKPPVHLRTKKLGGVPDTLSRAATSPALLSCRNEAKSRLAALKPTERFAGAARPSPRNTLSNAVELLLS